MYPFTKLPNADAVLYKLIEKIGNNISYDELSSELNKHPDYPNLLALSDVLFNFGVGNKAYRIKSNDLANVPLPFIANTHESGREYLLVHNVSIDVITVSDGNSKPYIVTKTKFLEKFNGVVFIAERSSNQNVKKFKSSISSFLSSSRYPIAVLFIFVLVLLSVGFLTPFMGNLTWILASTMIVKIAGTATSILLLVQSINSNNPLIQKICSGKSSNCSAILNSKAAQVFEGLTWSEVGFFYFAGSLLSILFNSGSSVILQLLSIFSALCLPYTVYSIHHQWRVAKQWCVLCCTVQALLWLDFLTLFRNVKYPVDTIDSKEYIKLVVCFGFPILVWVLLKPLLLAVQKVSPLQSQLRTFKFNTNIFNSQLAAQPVYAIPDSDWSIILGNVEANNVITMVSNPYCQPCARAHQFLHEWLEKNPDLQVRVVFTATNHEKDKRAPIVRHMMALNQLENKQIVKEAMHDWYNQNEKNYEVWAKRYPVDLDETQFFKLEKQRSWCKIIEVSGTPTFMINKTRLPKSYQIQDIKYLLN